MQEKRKALLLLDIGACGIKVESFSFLIHVSEGWRLKLDTITPEVKVWSV
jgi:hypothetical protein